MKTAAEKALAERNLTYRRYRAAKRAQFKELYAAEPRLEHFRKQLRQFIDPDEMLSFVESEIDHWLGNADPNIKAGALTLIDDRIIRIREQAGLDPFDDPWPDDDATVFLTCRRWLI